MKQAHRIWPARKPDDHAPTGVAVRTRAPAPARSRAFACAARLNQPVGVNNFFNGNI
jgi:hypothetical protein